MRLTILGGGGFRVPLVYRALCADPELGVDELVLYDVEPSRLVTMSAVLEHLAEGVDHAPRVDSFPPEREVFVRPPIDVLANFRRKRRE